jgi:hypothetical protein
VWLIYSGLRKHEDQAIVPSAIELVRRCMALSMYWQSRLRARWWQFRYGAESSFWRQMIVRSAWLQPELTDFGGVAAARPAPKASTGAREIESKDKLTVTV